MPLIGRFRNYFAKAPKSDDALGSQRYVKLHAAVPGSAMKLPDLDRIVLSHTNHKTDGELADLQSRYNTALKDARAHQKVSAESRKAVC